MRSVKAIKFIVCLIIVSFLGLLAFAGCSDKPEAKAASDGAIFTKANTAFVQAQKLHAQLQTKSVPVTQAANQIIVRNNRIDELATQKSRLQDMVNANDEYIDQLKLIIDGKDLKPGILKELEISNAELSELNKQKTALETSHNKAQRLASDLQDQANGKLRLAEGVSGDEKVKLSTEGFDLHRKSNAAMIEAQTLTNQIEMLEGSIAVAEPLNKKLQKDLREIEERIVELDSSPDFTKLKSQLSAVGQQLGESQTELGAAVITLTDAKSNYAKESEEVITLLKAAIKDYEKVRSRQLRSAASERIAISSFWIASVCAENVTLAMHTESIIECLPENTAGRERIIGNCKSDRSKYGKRAFENYDLAAKNYGQIKDTANSEHACYITKRHILTLYEKIMLAEAIGEYDVSTEAADLFDKLLEKAEQCDPDFSKTITARLIDGKTDQAPVLPVDNTAYYENIRKKFQNHTWPKLPADEREEAVNALLADLEGLEAEDTFDRQAYDRILGPEKQKLESALKRGFDDFDDEGFADPNF